MVVRDKDGDELETDDTSDSPPETPHPKKKGPPPPPSAASSSSVSSKKDQPRPWGPPVDEDGKPIPPPPIIGPDGKEIPRPRDAQGNPLPIYTTPEGKPILDDNGKAIALKFDKNGQPIPLEVPGGGPHDELHPGYGLGSGGQQDKVKKVPSYVFWVGPINMAISFGILIYLIVTILEQKEREKDQPDKENDTVSNEVLYLSIAAALQGLGIFIAILPMVASKKDSTSFIWAWLGLAAFFCFCHIILCWLAGGTLEQLIPGFYSAIRLLLSLISCCFITSSSSNTTNYGTYNYASGTGVTRPMAAQQQGQMYPGQGQQLSTVQAPNVVVQQPAQTTTTMVYNTMMPAYGMGYGGWGYPAYGMGYGMGMGYGLGYGAGLGGWGLGGWGYGGWGGYGCGYGGCGYGGFGGIDGFYF